MCLASCRALLLTQRSPAQSRAVCEDCLTLSAYEFAPRPIEQTLIINHFWYFELRIIDIRVANERKAFCEREQHVSLHLAVRRKQKVHYRIFDTFDTLIDS
jgi:hypothetical protein